MTDTIQLVSTVSPGSGSVTTTSLPGENLLRFVDRWYDDVLALAPTDVTSISTTINGGTAIVTTRLTGEGWGRFMERVKSDVEDGLAQI